MTELDPLCSMSESSIFWERHPSYREPFEVLAKYGIVKRIEMHEYIEKTGKTKHIAYDIYEHSHRYKLVKGYKVSYENFDGLSIDTKIADEVENALKILNISYDRDTQHLSIEESWDAIESTSYMHIWIKPDNIDEVKK